jgi:hypothetical protein
MVKINEFYQQPIDDTKLPFDVVDDLAIFMRNDPMFYRKSLFPAIMDMKDCCDKGTKYNAPKNLMPVIDKATESYCKHFKMNKRPEQLLSDEEKKTLLNKIYAEEMTNIRKGAY